MDTITYNLVEIVDSDKAPELIIFTKERFRDFLRSVSQFSGKTVYFSENWPMWDKFHNSHRIIFADSWNAAKDLENELFEELNKKEKS